MDDFCVCVHPPSSLAAPPRTTTGSHVLSDSQDCRGNTHWWRARRAKTFPVPFDTGVSQPFYLDDSWRLAGTRLHTIPLFNTELQTLPPPVLDCLHTRLRTLWQALRFE